MPAVLSLPDASAKAATDGKLALLCGHPMTGFLELKVPAPSPLVGFEGNGGAGRTEGLDVLLALDVLVFMPAKIDVPKVFAGPLILHLKD